MGDPVLGRNNQPVTIGADGKVDPRNLNVVLLSNPEKVGDNYITGTPGAVAGQTAGTVRAGALEGSGADANQAMVDMIASMRAYEAGQKVIHTIDETLGKAASSVGSLSRPKALRPLSRSRIPMLEGLRTAAAGMLAQQQKLDAVSNDLANANTNGYKRLRVGFSDLLYERAAGRRRPTTRSSARARASSTTAATFEQGSLAEHRRPARRRHRGRGLHQGQALRRPPGADPRRRPAHRRPAAGS